MKMSMKHVIKTAAVAGALTMVSGMAFADHHNESAAGAEYGTDSANDPTDVQPETRQGGKIDPGEPVVDKQENNMSANDSADVQPETRQEGKVDPGEPVVDAQENTMSDSDPSE